ncbi:hypothetical protein O7626_11965 [Micromonospora sp. WMMD1102]|uniref:hypothetical protein n=1 Tax=Micromonospora sp. WMMD1102 TaxID=3016105 RepID=UPI002415204E|nr:hypothetical protein [Micromonospora sp. WMMD1102]MDG4786638.1 hypothetical protein [Micromonospora sp. WMMD1102]
MEASDRERRHRAAELFWTAGRRPGADASREAVDGRETDGSRETVDAPVRAHRPTA